MTDVRKVVSSLNTPTLLSTTNIVKTPEGDRPVFYDKMGFLNTDYPAVLSGVRPALTGTGTSRTAVRNISYTQVMGNTAGNNFLNNGQIHGAADGPLDPVCFDPRRRFLVVTPNGEPKTSNPPHPGGVQGMGGISAGVNQGEGFIPYLKECFGPDNIVPGLMWTITLINDGAFAFTFSVTAPGAAEGTVTRVGFGSGGTDIVLPAKDAMGSSSVDLTIVVTGVTPGAESLLWIAHNHGNAS